MMQNPKETSVSTIKRCQVCSRVFRTKEGLKGHLQFRHGPGDHDWPGLPSMYMELTDKLDLILDHVKPKK